MQVGESSFDRGDELADAAVSSLPATGASTWCDVDGFVDRITGRGFVFVADVREFDAMGCEARGRVLDRLEVDGFDDLAGRLVMSWIPEDAALDAVVGPPCAIPGDDDDPAPDSDAAGIATYADLRTMATQSRTYAALSDVAVSYGALLRSGPPRVVVLSPRPRVVPVGRPRARERRRSRRARAPARSEDGEPDPAPPGRRRPGVIRGAGGAA
jgi:hypothetical protein